MRGIWAAMAAGIVLAAASSAMAAPVIYNFTGDFNNGAATGSLTGSVTFDDATGIASAITINVTAGKATDGVANLPAQTYTFAGHATPTLIGASTAVPAAGLRGAILRFQAAAPLGSPTPLTLDLVEAVCSSNDCSGLNVTTATGRYATITSFAPAPPPTPAAVPTMTEWAMILFGMLLAGGAALHLGQRRGLA